MKSLMEVFLTMLFALLMVALIANYEGFEKKFDKENQIKKIENIKRTYEGYRF